MAHFSVPMPGGELVWEEQELPGMPPTGGEVTEPEAIFPRLLVFPEPPVTVTGEQLRLPIFDDAPPWRAEAG